MSVAIGDLTGDGTPDLAVANQASNTVSVLFGNGDGTVALTVDFGTGSSPVSVAIGDLNGDELPDLAVANLSSTVSVLLAEGGGDFSRAQTDFVTGSSPFSVALGDLNRDGRLDVTTANADANTVSVLLGNGDGTFRPKTDFATGLSPFSVAIGDLNVDGRLDLAVANRDTRTISVLLGNGDGTFGPKVDFGAGIFPVSVAIGDLNGDRLPDLAVANAGSVVDPSSTVSVLLGKGDGSFEPKVDFGTGLSPSSVTIGDLNGDGQADLAVANAGSAVDRGSTVSVLLGNGDGSFGPKSDFGTGKSPLSVAIGDLNGDGRADLAVANLGSNTVSLLLGNGDGTFGQETDFGTESLPFSVAIGDLSGDGQPDLAVANTGSFVDPGCTVSVLLGNGDGTFGQETDFGTGIRPFSVVIGDLNGDGRLDLATANERSNTVSVLLGNGDGTFRTKTDFGTGSGPVSVAIGDLNGDGRPDLAVANAGSDSAPDSTVAVLLGNGDGTFRTKSDFAAGVRPFSVATGDLNGDGRLDLAVANRGSDTVSVLLGNGDGALRPKTDFAVGSGPNSVAIGDLNADGRLDLAVANLISSTVSVLSGIGEGSFAPETTIQTGRGTVSVVVADVNGDRRLDLAVAIEGANAVSLLLGKGNFGFFEAQFGAGISPDFVAVGDLNGDLRPDLAVANLGSTVSVLLNRGTNPVAVAVDDLEATASDGRVQIRWRLSSEALQDLQGIAIQRARVVDGPYVVCNSNLLQPALEMSFEDASLENGSYWYRLLLVSRGGSRALAGPVRVEIGSGAPHFTALYQPFDPANGGPIQIRYSLAGARMRVRLAIYDVRGHRMWSSERSVREPGEHTQTWERRDASGALVSRGVYFVALDADGIMDSKKLLLVHR